jgi:hypothetical protein
MKKSAGKPEAVLGWLVRDCRVLIAVVLAGAIVLAAGCHGTGETEPPLRGSQDDHPLAGIWQLMQLGETNDGPWYSAFTMWAYGDWAIVNTESPPGPRVMGATGSGTWGRSIGFVGHPPLNDSGTWTSDASGYQFLDTLGQRVEITFGPGYMSHDIDVPGVFTGVAKWRKMVTDPLR